MSKKDKIRQGDTFVDEPQIDELPDVTTPEPDSSKKEDEPHAPPGDDEYTEKKVKYIVAEGRSISGTRRGVIASGDEVKPGYFKRGQAVIDELVAAGSVKAVEVKEE